MVRDAKLYFVEAASDGRGRRVLVRDAGGCENWLYSSDEVSDAMMLILGLSDAQQAEVRDYLGRDTQIARKVGRGGWRQKIITK